MEQSGGYWMWTRSSNLMNMSDHQRKSVHEDQTWEEQAFAEDSAGHLGGGCVWPPRSYTCSFCRREFRSAQALGGHMNVHRRDRARLKQYPLSTHDHPAPPHNNNIVQLDDQIPFITSLSTGATVQNPSHQVCTSLVFNPNPRFFAPSPPRVLSASSTQEDYYPNTKYKQTKSLVSPSYSPPIVHESLFSNPSITSDVHSIAPTRFLILSSAGSSKHDEEDEKLKEMENTRLRVHDDGECIELNPSVSLSLVSRSGNSSRGCRLDVDDNDHKDDVDEGVIIGKKRRRTNEEYSSLPPFFLNTNFINSRNIRLKSEELLGLKQSSIMEELDLELRLGDQPAAKVK